MRGIRTHLLLHTKKSRCTAVCHHCHGSAGSHDLTSVLLRATLRGDTVAARAARTGSISAVTRGSGDVGSGIALGLAGQGYSLIQQQRQAQALQQQSQQSQQQPPQDPATSPPPDVAHTFATTDKVSVRF